MMTPEGATDLVLAAICAALIWRKHKQSPGLAAALAAADPASAEERKMLVGSFEDIQVFGDINVEILTGKSPTARAIGDKRVLDGAGQFRTAEGDDGQPAEDDDEREGDEGLHGFGGASMTLADCSSLVKHLSTEEKQTPRSALA